VAEPCAAAAAACSAWDHSLSLVRMATRDCKMAGLLQRSHSAASPAAYSVANKMRQMVVEVGQQ
jgi:hypothetical protein